MSVVVGIVDKNKVYLGSDRQTSFYNMKQTVNYSKIFRKEGLGFGVVGSPRIHQILREGFQIPPIKYGQTFDGFLVNDFIPTLQNTFEKHGAMTNDEGVKSFDSVIMVGIYSSTKSSKGRLFVIYENFQFNEVKDDYMAIGSGKEFALGSLATTEKMKLSAHDRIKLALEAAAKSNLFVGKPFDYLVIEESK